MEKINHFDCVCQIGPRMYTHLGSSCEVNVKSENSEGAVHLLIPENLFGIRIELYRFLETFILV